jgi:hypothetical protein
MTGKPYPRRKAVAAPRHGLDVKKNILSAPLPDPNDDSAEAHRMRALILAAADSTIEQTIRLQTNQLAATNSHDDEIGKIFEERQRRWQKWQEPNAEFVQ